MSKKRADTGAVPAEAGAAEAKVQVADGAPAAAVVVDAIDEMVGPAPEAPVKRKAPPCRRAPVAEEVASPPPPPQDPGRPRAALVAALVAAAIAGAVGALLLQWSGPLVWAWVRTAAELNAPWWTWPASATAVAVVALAACLLQGRQRALTALVAVGVAVVLLGFWRDSAPEAEVAEVAARQVAAAPAAAAPETSPAPTPTPAPAPAVATPAATPTPAQAAAQAPAQDEPEWLRRLTEDQVLALGQPSEEAAVAFAAWWNTEGPKVAWGQAEWAMVRRKAATMNPVPRNESWIDGMIQVYYDGSNEKKAVRESAQKLAAKVNK